MVGLRLDDAPEGVAVAHQAAHQLRRDLLDRAGVELGRQRHAGRDAPTRARARSSCSRTRASEVPPADCFDSSGAPSRSSSASPAPSSCGASSRSSSADSSGQRQAAVERPAHQAADDAVRLAERDPLAHQQVGHVGGRQELVGRGGGHALAVEADRAQHRRGHAQAQLDRVDGVEERLLVLLEILVVGERQAVEHALDVHQARQYPRRLRAQQLGGVGVLLLRHQARARGEGVGHLAEAELLARPEHDLGAELRQVGGAGGGRRQVVEHEVAVRHRVQRVVRPRARSPARRPGSRGRSRSSPRPARRSPAAARRWPRPRPRSARRRG